MITPFCISPVSSNNLQSALHFLSKRCSSLSRELLKVSRAEIPYSFIKSNTFLHRHPQILLVLRPRYNPLGHHRQIQYHTNHKNILDVPEITAKTLYTIHKTQTAPEDDTVLYFFSLIVPPYSIRSIRYPIPICVCIYWSPFLSGSSFFRNVAINTLSEATSFCEQFPHICCVI